MDILPFISLSVCLLEALTLIPNSALIQAIVRHNISVSLRKMTNQVLNPSLTIHLVTSESPKSKSSAMYFASIA